MQWDISDHQDWRVVDNTRWLNISNYQNLKARAGVYIFADVNHQVKYIGKAGAGRIVDETYNAIYRGKNRGATQALKKERIRPDFPKAMLNEAIA